jgi:hypothetical protein
MISSETANENRQNQAFAAFFTFCSLFTGFNSLLGV